MDFGYSGRRTLADRWRIGQRETANRNLRPDKHFAPPAVDATAPHAYNGDESAGAIASRPANRSLLAMVLLEMSISPLGVGDSVSQYVAECVELVGPQRPRL